jgi:alanine racemase
VIADERETGCRLTIDLGALAANWRELAALAAPAECAAVVKADAYGIGTGRAVAALHAAGARTFFVAHPAEARRVRAAAPDAVIYVLNGLTPGTAPLVAALGARPVLGSLAEIDDWAAFVRTEGGAGEAAVHVDTGMNRLGLGMGAAQEVAARHAAGTLGFRPALVMSHVACADTPEAPLNARQREAFAAVRGAFPGVPASLANSAATLLGPAWHFDLCRPGIALYGGAAQAGGGRTLRPVVRLEARIVQVRTADAGESVGYGASQHLRRPSRLAVLSLGYADGIPRIAGSADDRPGAEVVIAGRRCPLAGRISMDLMTADVTDLPDGAVARGDWAVVLGDGIGVDDLAHHAGTIGYEILTNLGRRCRRIYLGG